jgi:hypothetical protein
VCIGQEGISQGLKPAFLAGFDARAKAQAYLRSRDNDKGKTRANKDKSRDRGKSKEKSKDNSRDKTIRRTLFKPPFYLLAFFVRLKAALPPKNNSQGFSG